MVGMESGTPRMPRAGRSSGLSGLAVLLLLLHAAGFGLWVALNLGLVPRVPAFDPYPFPLLTLIASSEAVLLCLVVLVRLGRMEARAEERYRLALRTGLLVEEEVVEAARMLERVEARLGGGHGSTNPRVGGHPKDRPPSPGR
jgi:uncharacterized membrane protein